MHTPSRRSELIWPQFPKSTNVGLISRIFDQVNGPQRFPTVASLRFNGKSENGGEDEELAGRYFHSLDGRDKDHLYDPDKGDFIPKIIGATKCPRFYQISSPICKKRPQREPFCANIFNESDWESPSNLRSAFDSSPANQPHLQQGPKTTNGLSYNSVGLDGHRMTPPASPWT